MAKRKLGYGSEPLGRKIDQPKYVKNKPVEVISKPLGPKYELTDNVRFHRGEKLYQIRALRDFDNVKVGDLGGYVAGEHNLSHDGNCWLAQRSISCGNGRVTENAWGMDDTVIKDDGILAGTTRICDRVQVRGSGWVKGAVELYGDIIVGGKTILNDNHKFNTKEELSAFLKAEFEKRSRR